MTVGLEHYLTLATIIFAIGVCGAIFRRNLLVILMSIQLMLCAASLAFIAASRALNHLDGQIMVIFIVAAAACEAAVGLAMVMTVYKRYGTIMTDHLRTLRG